MAVIVTRAGKGSPLTNAEVDQNFLNLNAAVVAAPGDVVGPAGATDNFLVRFDGVTGKLLQSSSWQISDPGHLLPGAAGTLDIGSTAVRVHTLFGTTGDFSSQVNSGRMTLNLSGQAPPGYIDGSTMMQINSGAGARLEFNTFQGGVAYISTRHARGLPGAPTASVSGDWMASWGARGYGATGYALNEGATIVARASETWTDTRQGTDFVIGATPVGTNTIAWSWVFQGLGTLEPFYDNLYDIGSAGRRVRNVFASGVDLSGPNAILTLHGRSGAGAWGLYSGNGAALQFFNGAIDVAALSSTGSLNLNGSLSANGNVSATGTIQAPVVSGGPSGLMSMSGTAGVNTVLYFDVVTPNKPAYFAYDLVGNYLDLSLGGVHVAEFTPSEKSLIVVGPVRSSSFIVTPPTGQGYITLNPGSNNNSGFIGFFDPANTRVGYLGFAYASTKTIVIAAEAGYSYQFGQSFSTQGEVIFGPSLDVAEPRGRYWSRPAPNGNYTLALADAGSFLVQVAAVPNTITIPPQSAVAWKSWTRIDFVQYGPGQITFAPGVGVTLNATGGKRKTTGQLSVASLIQINPDEWLLVGDLTL